MANIHELMIEDKCRESTLSGLIALHKVKQGADSNIKDLITEDLLKTKKVTVSELITLTKASLGDTLDICNYLWSLFIQDDFPGFEPDPIRMAVSPMNVYIDQLHDYMDDLIYKWCLGLEYSKLQIKYKDGRYSLKFKDEDYEAEFFEENNAFTRESFDNAMNIVLVRDKYVHAGIGLSEYYGRFEAKGEYITLGDYMRIADSFLDIPNDVDFVQNYVSFETNAADNTVRIHIGFKMMY